MLLARPWFREEPAPQPSRYTRGRRLPAGDAALGWAQPIQRAGGEGTIFVSHAGDATDPFEAVKGNIARSKDLVAAASKDLRQHDRWFGDYLASEMRNRVKHARELERRRAERKRHIKRQKMVRSGRRLATAYLRSVRSVSLSLWNSAASALRELHRLLLLVIRWLGPKVQALSLSLVGLLSAGASWMGAEVRALSLTVFKAASASSAWIAAKTVVIGRSLRPVLLAGAFWMGAKARALSLASFRAASASSAWFDAKTVALARSLRPVLLAGAFWMGAKARALERALLTAALIGGSWLRVAASDLMRVVSKSSKAVRLGAQRGQGRIVALACRLAQKTKSGFGERKRAISRLFEQRADTEMKSAASPHGETALERSRALVPVEPLRCRLPVVQTS